MRKTIRPVSFGIGCGSSDDVVRFDDMVVATAHIGCLD